jgi:hypothetical protein
MCLSLSDFKDIFTIAGALGSFILVLLALRQYGMAEKQKRAEHFFKLRDKYNSDPAFIKIREIIDSPDPNAMSSRIGDDEKRKFLGFYEEIAIMVNSKLIKEELAFYMFGYYAIRCTKLEVFKTYINEDAAYWKVFSEFATKMEVYDNNSDKISLNRMKL